MSPGRATAGKGLFSMRVPIDRTFSDTGSADHSKPYRVVFVLVPGFSMMALSSALEPLRSVNRLTGEKRYLWHIIGQKPGFVSASNGLDVQTAHGLDDAPSADLTIVVASLDVENFKCKPLLGYLRRIRQQRKPVGAISNGTLILARAGLLKGRKATIHWEMQAALAQKFPEIEVCNTLYCMDFDVMTSGGGIAAMDMMLELIAARDGRAIAVDVSEQFLHGPARNSLEIQRQEICWRYGVTDRHIEVAIEIMEDRIANPLKISKLAEAAGISERQLERLFNAAFGKSPSDFYRELRLKAAQARILASTESLEEIAAAMGFSSQAHFSRAVKAWCGVSPLALRKNGQSANVESLQKNVGWT